MKHQNNNLWGRVLALFLAVILISGSEIGANLKVYAKNQTSPNSSSGEGSIYGRDASKEESITEEICQESNKCDSDEVIKEKLSDSSNSYYYEGTNFLYNGNTITGYSGTPANVLKIPSEIRGVAIETIGYNAFYRCSNITEIVFPEGIKEIKRHSFEGTSITELDLPGTLKTIGEGSFRLCVNLEKVFIPASLETVAGDVSPYDGGGGIQLVPPFDGCSSISTIEFEEGRTKIPSFLFYDGDYGHNKITSITLPDTTVEIGDYAFYSCNKLQRLTVPSTLEKIGVGAFLASEYPASREIVYDGDTDAWNEIEIGNKNTWIDQTSKTYQNGLIYRVIRYVATDGTCYEMKKVEKDSILPKPYIPVKQGYRLIGYYWEEGHKRMIDFRNILVTSSMTFRVNLSPGEGQFRVIYKADDATSGTLPEDYCSYVSADTIFVIGGGDLQKEGFSFKGWTRTAEGRNHPLHEGSVIGPYDYNTENIILYAVFEPDSPGSYTVTYKKNGATSGFEPIDRHTYADNEMVMVSGPNRLQKQGFTFKGWSLNADGSGKLYNSGDIIYDISGNIIFYAVWEAASQDKYTVSYNGNGATSGDVPVDNKEYSAGDSVEVKNEGNLEKEGCTFLGWSLNASGTGTLYQGGDVINNITGSIVLYAVWETASQDKYTVSYNGNGATSGEVPVDNNEYSSGDSVEVKNEGNLVNEGYIFSGWSTAPDGAEPLYQGGNTIIITENITLYAIWVADPSIIIVTYNSNGATSGEVPTDDNKYVAGDTVTVLSAGNLEKKGYLFKGWRLLDDENDTLYKNGDIIPNITKSITLCAEWKRIFTLEMDNNNFVNHWEGFFSSENGNFYNFKNEEYLDKLKRLSNTDDEIEEIDNRISEPWDGSCYGIATTMSLIFTGRLDTSALGGDSSKDYHSLSAPINNDSLFDAINFYQAGQSIKKMNAGTMLVYTDKTKPKTQGSLQVDLESFLRQLVERTADNNIVVFSYGIPNWGGHAILAVNSYKDEENGEYIVVLYDENTASDKSDFTYMHVKEDYSSFEYMTYDNPPYKLNEVYSHLCIRDPAKYPLFTESDLLLGESLTNTQLFSNDTEGEVLIDLPWAATTNIVNDKGQTLSLENSNANGSMNIYDTQYFIADEASRIQVKVDKSDSFKIVSNDMDVSLIMDGKTMTIKGKGMENATLSLSDDKITISGNDFSFDARISSQSSDSTLSILGEATGDTTVSVAGDTIKASTTGTLREVSSITYTGNEFKEERIEKTEDGVEARHTPKSYNSGTNPEAELTSENELYLVKGQTYRIASTGWRIEAGSKELSLSTKNGVTTITAKKTASSPVSVTNGTDTYKIYIVAPSATVDGKKSKKLVIGNTAEVKINGIPAEILDNYAVAWTSAKTEVATVAPSSGSTAIVTAIGKGSSKITAYVGGKAYSCTVTVTDDAKSIPKLIGESADLTLNPMQTVSLKYSSFNAKNAEWRSTVTPIWTEVDPDKNGSCTGLSDGIVKIVKKNGKITAVGSGETTITGTDTAGNAVTLHIRVIPLATNPVAYVRCGKNVTLKASKLNKKYTEWRVASGSEYVVASSLNNGKIKAASSLPTGTTDDCAVITCKFKPFEYSAGFDYNFRVYVEEPSLKTSAGGMNAGTKTGQYTLNLKKAETFSLKDQYAGICRGVIWKSSKPAIAYIDENGVIHANRAGTTGSTKLTATISGVKLTVTVNVTP